MDAEGWENKPDAGWGKYDVEIFGNRWSRLRLTTVTEYLPEQARITKCRLDVTWSLRATAGFWLVAALELVAIGLFARVEHWIWMLLLTLPVLSWFLEFEKRWLQQQVALLIRELAAELGWKPIAPSAPGPGAGTVP